MTCMSILTCLCGHRIVGDELTIYYEDKKFCSTLCLARYIALQEGTKNVRVQ